MQAEYKFQFSEEHLLTSVLRYRQQIWWCRPFLTLKWTLASVFGIPILIAIYQGIPALAAFFGAILGALLLGWPIDAWIIRRRFRKSPYHNDAVTLSLADSGVYVIGKNSESRIAWKTFTKARRFNDGLLLFQGPGLFNWLPDAAANDSTTPEIARKVVRSYVKDYRDV